MIKLFPLFFNLLGLFICRLFLPVSVNVSQTTPSSVEVNSSFLVQVTINKGDLKGIAVFAEQLPKGFTAAAVDNEGAKTSFINNTIQFSWDSLPPDGIINISFRVDVSSLSSMGKGTLTGRFLYTINNQKSEADCLPSYINIMGTQITESVDSEKTNSLKQGAGGVVVLRRFPSLSLPPDSDAIVTLIIHKANITGFAKIEDSLPPGYVAASIDNRGASFTYVDNIVKFVWQSLPPDSVITISYRIMAGFRVSGIHTINGNFSYLFNGTPVFLSIDRTNFNTTISSENKAITLNSINQSSSQTKATHPDVHAGKNKIIQNSQQSSSSNTTTKPSPNNIAANIPSSSLTPQTGINYRVQIMALHNPVDVSYFSLKWKIKNDVNAELNGGFTKYLVGNYKDYKSVRDAREDYRNQGIDGPFVISYNSGVRITVQEALMISRQQWYK